MRDRTGGSFGKVLFELFLVFVAVVAALYASAWWEGRKAKAGGRAALVAFADEMRSNKGWITERLDHHLAIARNARALLQEIAAGQQPPRDVDALRTRLTDGKGMRTPQLSRAAWDTAIAANVVGAIPFAIMRRIALAYEIQRRLDALLDSLIDQFAAPSYYDASRMEATVTAFMVTFGMIHELETQQVAAYDDCLTMLGG